MAWSHVNGSLLACTGLARSFPETVASVTPARPNDVLYSDP
jgi:hypothetical protein